MRKLLALALLLALTVCAHAQFMGLGGNITYPTVQLTNRTFVPNTLLPGASYTQAMSETFSTTRLAVSDMAIIIPGWYNIQEISEPGTDTVTASVEYPPGTCHQFLFGGSASGTVPSGGNLVSDRVSVSIPTNTVVGIRIYHQNASGIPATQSVTGPGEVITLGLSGVADQTVSCDAISNNAVGVMAYPSAIVGTSPILNPVSACIWGDSRAVGIKDVANVKGGDQGSVARSLSSVPYINLSIQSQIAQNGPGAGTTHGANRLSYAQYCTSLISEMGFNDLNTGRTWAQLQTNLTNAYAAFALPAWQTTINPSDTSTDSFATPVNCAASPGNQTPFAAASVLAQANTAILSVLPRTLGSFDLSSPVSCNYATSVFAWLPGMVFSDGVHETQLGDQTIAASGNLNPAVLH